MKPLARQALAEFTGTALLLAAVIGSGIMAERLSGGNAGVALLANALATVFALFVLIETLGPVSGAHFNPVVTLVLEINTAGARARRAQIALVFIAAQLAGAAAGAWLAHAMFELPLLQASTRLRTGTGQWIAEAVATAGLIFVILRAPAGKGSALVACYIGAKRSWAPVHGFYLACYTVDSDKGPYGYAKICAGPPEEVWDAKYAIRKVSAGPCLSHAEAIDSVVAHATARLARRSGR
jgi:glycerol uptake facilitator-like aquaporin